MSSNYYEKAKELIQLPKAEFDLAVSKPFFAEAAVTNIDGVPAKRLMIGLKAPGCAYRRQAMSKGISQCQFCVLTNYYSTGGRKVTAEQFVGQIAWALDQPEADECERVEVFNAGSFFCNDEIDAESRTQILVFLAKQNVKSILVEARITDFAGEGIKMVDEALATIKQAKPECKLEIAIGLEVSDRQIGQQIGKSSRDRLAEIIAELKDRQVRVQFYALIKPIPMSEKEAIESATETIRTVAEQAHSLGLTDVGLKPRVSLAPTRVYVGSELAKMAEYRVTTLWSVIEVIRKSAQAGLLEHHTLQIGLSDEGIPVVENGEPKNCGKCDSTVIKALEAFNASQSVEVMDEALGTVESCPCHQEWREQCR